MRNRGLVISGILLILLGAGLGYFFWGWLTPYLISLIPAEWAWKGFVSVIIWILSVITFSIVPLAPTTWGTVILLNVVSEDSFSFYWRRR